MKRVILGVILAVVGIGVAAFTSFHNNANGQRPVVFSNNTMLSAIWHSYKVNYVEPSSGRTLDKQRDNVTTSEGESYTMLRAVFQDDKATFDQSWNFTKNNLQHKNDHLFGYLYGKRSDGSYGLLSDKGGDNSASDADSDIALALVLGYQRWQQSGYLEQSKQVMNDIWKQEVVTIQNRPVLTADNLEHRSTTTVVVNPSYFSPYASKIFAGVDQGHDWKALSDNSYDVLKASMASNLDTAPSKGLPPDWIMIDRTSGAITPALAGNLTSNFGYDALRVPWRLGLDYEWNKDPRDKQVLQKMSFLQDEWAANHSVKATYSHDGKTVQNYESPAMYGGAMGYFATVSPDTAEQVYKTKLESLYSTDTQSWKTTLSYYDDNWAWFGMALKLHQLPNLGSSFVKSTS
jgi:endo-1,4-beta-D-glucanase Y